MYFEKSHFFPFFLAIRHFHVIFSGVRKKLLKDFKKMEFNEAELTNQDTIRKLMLLKREIGKYLTGDKLTKVTKLKNDMFGLIVDANRKFGKLMKTSPGDPEKLQSYWRQWRELSGDKMSSMYNEYIELENEGAKLSGYRLDDRYRGQETLLKIIRCLVTQGKCGQLRMSTTTSSRKWRTCTLR